MNGINLGHKKTPAYAEEFLVASELFRPSDQLGKLTGWTPCQIFEYKYILTWNLLEWYSAEPNQLN